MAPVIIYNKTAVLRNIQRKYLTMEKFLFIQDDRVVGAPFPFIRSCRTIIISLTPPCIPLSWQGNHRLNHSKLLVATRTNSFPLGPFLDAVEAKLMSASADLGNFLARIWPIYADGANEILQHDIFPRRSNFFMIIWCGD